MSSTRGLEGVLHQLQAFKKKFYLNLLIRGSIFAAGLLLTFFLVYNLLEYYFYFPQYVRAFLLFSFIALVIYAVYRWIFTPVTALANLKRLLTDEQAAQQVGAHYPEIKDKLLNAIQLKDLDRTNALIAASIDQKTAQLDKFHFTEVVDYKQNKPILKYLAIPLGIVLVLALLYPAILVQGTERIINYNRFYAPQAPFNFVIENQNLQAYRNEDFQLKVRMEGKTIPEQVTIMFNGREQKLTRGAGNQFTYDFKKIQKPVTFQLAGAGFYSEEHNLDVLTRPNLKDFFVQIAYPNYLGKKPETIRNTGNLTVPEGSQVQWNFAAAETRELTLKFDRPEQVLQARPNGETFQVTKKITASQPYSVHLKNQHGSNKEEISYLISTIPDRHPEISAENFNDTITFTRLIIGGNVADDYGITRLNLHYRVKSENQKDVAYKQLPLRFDPKQLSQTYYHQWNIASLNLKPGDRLEYFVQTWDNDGVNGSKSARTRTMDFKIPSKADLAKEISANSKSVEQQMSKALEKSLKLQQELAKSEEKLKTKKDLNWQDKKSLEELVEKKKQLQADLDELKKMNEQLNQKQDRLDELSPELVEKTRQLQKLMDELLDEETRKLYEELEKLLQEKRQNQPEMQRLLDKLENKESNLEKELERALEMFKQLQFEQKLDESIKKLDELARKEEKLSEKSLDKNADNKELQKEQQNIKKEFDEVKKNLDDMKKLDKDLDNSNNMEQTDEQEDQVDQDMNDSEKSLEKNQNKKASKSQKSAADKMKEMADKMEKMKMQMQSSSRQENLDGLRDILENLITLSFDQEELMKNFRSVNQSDPRFIALSQQQLKLKDDAKIIEDSLRSLAKKVFQIQSFVTREVNLMNEHMDVSSMHIKDRNVPRATNHQQLAMTSMNNLALMLSDVLKQMQEQMAKEMKGQQQCSKPGGKPKPGEMGKMQDALNQKIEELKKGGKQGKALSEELAKLAAEQEMLRNALKELEKEGKEKGEKPGGGQLGDIKKMMEQTETDLVNKRLTEQTIMRQRDILTRLLEAEKASKERELDDKREAQTAQERMNTLPPSFEKYLRTKQKQTELLKTVSPALSPYYKQEVNEYFQKLRN